MSDISQIPQIKDIDFIVKIQRQGRVIIPKNIREMFELRTGDAVKLELKEIKRGEFPLRR